MDNKMIELYSTEEITLLKKKRNIWTGITIAIGALALALCILFCAKTNTANRDSMLIRTIVSSTLGGWIVISLSHFVIEEYRNAEKHVQAILDGPREQVEGPFEWTGEHLRVKKGVSITGIHADGEKREKLFLYDAKKKLFPKDKAVRVCTVYGFIVAYEVNDDVLD